MASSKSKLNLIVYYFFAVLIVYLPFSRLIEQILLYRTSLSEDAVFWLVHFYEPLLVIILLFYCFIVIRKGIRKIKFNWALVSAMLFLLLAVISVFALSPSISRGIEGFRFSAFFLLVFLTAYFSGLDKDKIYKLINIYLITAGLFAFWAILERALPVNYLSSVGLVNPSVAFGYGAHKVSTIYQSVTGIGGPNQLGSYLLPAIMISIFQISKLKSQTYNSKQKTLLILLVIFGVTAVALTLSRSAWVGLYVGLFVFAAIFVKNIKIKIATISVLVIIAALGLIYYTNQPRDILTHGASSESHRAAYDSSIAEIKNRSSDPIKLIFGSGIGTAGPASLKYGDGFVSESWYLQIILEMGIVGFLLWMALIISIVAKLYKKQLGLFLGLIAVSTAAIFLHTFADNPALAITLFVLIAGVISTNDKENR